MNNIKAKKEHFEIFKNFLYGIKTVSKASPMTLPILFLMECSYWFFKDFIMEVLFFKTLLSLIEGKGTFRQYMIYVIIFVLCGMLVKGIEMLTDYYIVICNRRLYKNIYGKIFTQAGKIDIECYENPVFYDKYTRATEMITERVVYDFCFDFAILIADIITMAALCVYVISVDPKLLFVLVLSVISILIKTFEDKIQVKRDKEMTTNNREKSYVRRVAYLKDFSKDMRTSGIFNIMQERYRNAVEKNREVYKKYGIKIAVIEVIVSLFSETLPTVASYVYTTYRYAFKHDLSASDFSVVITAVNTMRNRIANIMYFISALQKESMKFGFLKEFLSFEPKTVSGDKKAGEFESIEFKNVSFKYPSAENYSLKNINLKINSLERIATVGKNGAGKSTFVKLLLRFYDPTEGEILYNGVNISEYDISSLRERLSTVFQNYKVYALSIEENVLCREVVSDEDRNKSEKSLKMSGVYGKIETLPERAQTVLTREFDEKGIGLSGGEQQKVAAARMFAKNFDLAILDEPSSALDPIAEYKMYESIIEETENKSVIFISHRLSSASLSDRIFVFDNGTVVETGSHDELMKKDGIYAEMFTMQASNYTEEVDAE